jgi:hypothetical protein
MKKMWSKIIQFITWIRWIFRKRRRRLYEVIRCSTVSFIGMKAIGIPKRGKAYLLLSNKSGYRTITPLQIRKLKDGFDIYTKYNRIFIKRYF